MRYPGRASKWQPFLSARSCRNKAGGMHRTDEGVSQLISLLALLEMCAE